MLPSGVRMRVVPARAGPTGLLEVPDDITRAGWWVGSSRLGDGFGSMVLAAHVDSFTHGLGPISELRSAAPGDPVRVSGGGLAQRFSIDAVTYVRRADLGRRSELFAVSGGLRLVLITCGGPYDPEDGYRDNVVVLASPSRLPQVG